MYLNSINHFRAVSIVFIVVGHVYVLKDPAGGNIFEDIFLNLIEGGTLFFVFISGFLFYVVFYKKFKFLKFISNKFKNLIIPYTFLAIIPIYYYVTRDVANLSSFFVPEESDFAINVAEHAMKYYINGVFITAYWYIPFIFVMFLLSPFHFVFVKFNKYAQISVIVISFTISIFIHRPVDHINILHSIFYYFPVYLLGIWCAVHKEAVYKYLRDREGYILITALAIAAIQAFMGDVGNYRKPMLAYDGIDMMLLQKTALCLFFLVWLHRYDAYQNKLLSVLANTSFAIFFLHGFVILLLKQWPNVFNIPVAFQGAYYMFLTIPVLLACIVAAWLTKKVFSGYSRYLIGY